MPTASPVSGVQAFGAGREDLPHVDRPEPSPPFTPGAPSRADTASVERPAPPRYTGPPSRAERPSAVSHPAASSGRDPETDR
eukprot:6837294-Alexandrium_andersonii.AAC.1